MFACTGVILVNSIYLEHLKYLQIDLSRKTKDRPEHRHSASFQVPCFWPSKSILTRCIRNEVIGTQLSKMMAPNIMHPKWYTMENECARQSFVGPWITMHRCSIIFTIAAGKSDLKRILLSVLHLITFFHTCHRENTLSIQALRSQ